MDYDVVIPATFKDYHKLPYCVQSLKYLNPAPKTINIITPTEIDISWFEKIEMPGLCSISNVLEKSVFPDLNPLEAKNFRRPQWIYQQFIKLFHFIENDCTTKENDNYLVVDSDLILLKKLHLLGENGRPNFFLGVDQNHKPYFNMMEECLGFGRTYPHSFISELMLFNKVGTVELLHNIYFNLITKGVFKLTENKVMLSEVYEEICKKSCENWIPADYEIYGNYIEYFYPDFYNKVKFKTSLSGKHGNGLPPFPWTNEEILKEVDRVKSLDFDALTIHTWL